MKTKFYDDYLHEKMINKKIKMIISWTKYTYRLSWVDRIEYHKYVYTKSFKISFIVTDV